MCTLDTEEQETRGPALNQSPEALLGRGIRGPQSAWAVCRLDLSSTPDLELPTLT